MSEFKFAPIRDAFGEIVTPRIDAHENLPMKFNFAPAQVDAFNPDHTNPFDPGPIRKTSATTSFEGFHFAPGLAVKATEYFGAAPAATRSHHEGQDCDCSGTCDDCSEKVQDMSFAPGQKLRHKKTGELYHMVKTYCVTPAECYCVLKKGRSGRESEVECMFLPGEMEAVA